MIRLLLALWSALFGRRPRRRRPALVRCDRSAAAVKGPFVGSGKPSGNARDRRRAYRRGWIDRPRRHP